MAKLKREQVLVIIERRALTRWGVRIETTWTKASGAPETSVRYEALKPVGLICTRLIEMTWLLEQELLARWLLSWLVDPSDAQYATDVIDTYAINTPYVDVDDAAHA
jgi:hypothetical protein